MSDNTSAIHDALDSAAQGPREVEADGVRVQQHPLTDVVKVAKYAASRAAMSLATFGLRIAKISPPGAS